MGSRESGGPLSSDVQHTAGAETLGEFARHQVIVRLDRLSEQAARIRQSQDEESVHDFRVSIRRFTQGLILFPELVPKRGVAKVRKCLRKLMDETSEVRNRDIALEHLADSDDESLKERLRQERLAHSTRFAQKIARLVDRDFTGEWRTALGLEPR